MNYYSSLITIVCLMSLAMTVIIASDVRIDKNTKRGFIAAFALLLFTSAAEWAGVMLEGAPQKFRTLHLFLNMFELSAAPLIALICMGTICGIKSMRLMTAVCIANILFVIIFGLSGSMYFIDEHNVLKQGKLYWIYLVTYILCIIIFFDRFVSFSRRNQNQNTVMLAAVCFFGIFGIAIHFIYGNIRTNKLVAAITMSLIYHCYNAVNEQIDSLTQLLDRRSYENYISGVRKKTVFVILDIDSFKAVNDVYGHGGGDVCLRAVGRIIKNTYGKYGLCFRIGGDEFCVALTRKTESIEKINKDFIENIKKEKRYYTNGILPLVSVGYSIFTPGVNTYNDAIKQADEMMYKNKEIQKSGN